MAILDRFLKYVSICSASTENCETTPSGIGEFEIAHCLEQEMKGIGFTDVYCDANAYVYGFIPATSGMESMPCVAFIAHIDTVPDFSAVNVKPQIIHDYDGLDVVLGSSGRVLSIGSYPHLPSLKGQTLITTDGTTILGADDKAGIAEIMNACEQILCSDIPHGRIAVCFTPDEEIGHGASLLDLDRLNADFAFTVDGGAVNEVNCETFNAAAAEWVINGVNVHPGSAKDIMVNASLVATEINSLLPPDEIPSKTDNHAGFFHLTDISGNVERATLKYIIRDHDPDLFEHRKKLMKEIEVSVNSKYGSGTAILTIHDQYRNMMEKVSEHPEVIELMNDAIRMLGQNPVLVPVRGGTDGAQLSFRGLITPNLGTGGYAFHGPYEHITVEHMEEASQLIVNIIRLSCS